MGCAEFCSRRNCRKARLPPGSSFSRSRLSSPAPTSPVVVLTSARRFGGDYREPRATIGTSGDRICCGGSGDCGWRRSGKLTMSCCLLSTMCGHEGELSDDQSIDFARRSCPCCPFWANERRCSGTMWVWCGRQANDEVNKRPELSCPEHHKPMTAGSNGGGRGDL